MTPLEALAAEAAELRAEIESAPLDREARERIRERLLVLGREIEARIAELEGLRESLRPVAAQYRRLYRQSVPGLTRADHLGGSTYRERGWHALAAGDYLEAVRHLRRSAHADPGDRRARALLAWALAADGEIGEAEVTLGELTRTSDDRDPLAGTVLGYLRIVQNRPADAIPVLSAALNERADKTASLYAHLYLGIAHQKLGSHATAQRMLRTAIEQSPNLAEAYWQLGRSHLQEGRPDLALAAWRAGGENPFNPWGERCRLAAFRLEEDGFTESA